MINVPLNGYLIQFFETFGALLKEETHQAKWRETVEEEDTHQAGVTWLTLYFPIRDLSAE